MLGRDNNQFNFLPYRIEKNQEIIFRYQLLHLSHKLQFQEKITLPQPIPNTINQNLLSEVLNNLSLILGISYWKTFCPQKITLTNYQLTKKQADFWNIVYTKGLGEFFYKNKINFKNLVNFPVSNIKKSSVKKEKNNNKNRALLGIGGGKDSIVAAERLKKQKKDFFLFVLYHQKKSPIIQEVVKVIDKPVIWVKREIDPQLFKLNQKKTVYNGHIPFNAILSFIGLLLAIIYGFSEIITANEKDANEGNLIYLGEEINHQWSKTKEYKNLFNSYLKENFSSHITYFSILRHLDENQIAKEFSQYPQYFFHFSSCNQNFKINLNKKTPRWCGQCPKCLFTFLVLAPFIKKEIMIKIFNQNLLQRKDLLGLYKQLLGLQDNKPFECVGTKDTVKKASIALSHNNNYQNDLLIKFFRKKYEI